MDFIAAATTLLSTTLTSPAFPISEISGNSWHKNNYRSNPSSAIHNTARFPVTKFRNIAPGASLFSCIGHRKTRRTWFALQPVRGRRFPPDLCLASLGRAQASSIFHMTFPWTVCSIFGVQCWTFLAT